MQLIKFHRTMWGLRCKLVAEEKTETYEARQRLDILRMFQCLKQSPEELPDTALHYLEKKRCLSFTTHHWIQYRCGNAGYNPPSTLPLFTSQNQLNAILKKQRAAPKKTKKSKLKSPVLKAKRQKINKTKKYTKKRKKVQHTLQRHFIPLHRRTQLGKEMKSPNLQQKKHHHKREER